MSALIVCIACHRVLGTGSLCQHCTKHRQQPTRVRSTA